MENNSCYYCDSCDYCNSCYSCNYCNYCKNLKMTEYNIFCYSNKFNNSDSFQQGRYRAFNKTVGQERYVEIKSIVKDILGNKRLKLTDFWKQVTRDQWNKLLEIPEAKDFQGGFEYISNQKINVLSKVKIVCEGKEVEISRESAEALGLV